MSRIKIRSACAALWMYKRSKNCLFITFTFAYDVREDKAAEIWGLFLNNLRNHYKVNNYVWVKELQTKNNNRVHYHIIIDRDRINIKSCQKTFNTVVKNCDPSGDISFNSVRLGHNPIIRNYLAISRYISKYISKEHCQFNKRCYGYSENYVLKRKIEPEEIEKLIKNFGGKIIIDDRFFTIYRVNGYTDFPENRIFCTDT
jgi:hypothetical protein